MNKFIEWQHSCNDVPYHVNSIFIEHGSMVNIVIQHGMNVDSVKISMEHAQEIGFINLSALKKYCK